MFSETSVDRHKRKAALETRAGKLLSSVSAVPIKHSSENIAGNFRSRDIAKLHIA